MGYNYQDWLGNFYPQFCPPADFLRCYSNVFSAVELDSTLFRVPEPEMVVKWTRSTTASFRFAVRIPQTVTHEGDLDSRIAAAGSFLEVIRGLGEKLGPILMQFPSSFGPECQSILKELLKHLPTTFRIAAEFRHSDWFNPATYSLLKRHGVALCLTERLGIPRLDVRTADFVYLRLVGDCSQITEDFSYLRHNRTDELNHWARLAERYAADGIDTYSFCSNHFSGHAPTSALQFHEIIRTGSRGNHSKSKTSNEL